MSCNFFRGTFDLQKYVAFMDDFFRVLDVERRGKEGALQRGGSVGDKSD